MSKTTKSGVARRGFASMSPKQRTLVAQKGGSNVLPENRTYARDPELAREAGRKGGLAKAAKGSIFGNDTTSASAPSGER